MRDRTKLLIWLYLILLYFEGSLRKWVFPGAADALLIVRDPVVLLIYACALGSNRMPWNGFIAAIAVLAAASFLGSFAAGQNHVGVTLYGLRINYLHLPLIWVMASVLDRRDVERMGTFTLLTAIPMAALMVEQFRSPMNAPINRGVGGDELGQIFGADGRIRPPGFFAFITGPQLFLPLAAAFFIHQASTRRHLPWIALLIAGAAVGISLPVSISRTAMLATGLVAAAFVLSVLLSSRRDARIFRVLIAGGILTVGLSALPAFEEGRAVFQQRWETAAVSTGGDAWGNVYNRIFGGLGQPFRAMLHAAPFGAGIGVGSNVGARLLAGRMGFLLAEDEWTKVILELGPFLGALFIAFRITLTVWLGHTALLALRREGEALPLLIYSATATAILLYQWAPPTLLGFAVVGGGLVLAAAKPDRRTAPPELVMAVTPSQPELLPRATEHRPPVQPKHRLV